MAWKFASLLLVTLASFAASSPVEASALTLALSPPGETTWDKSLQKRDCDTLGAVVDTVSSGSEVAVYATTGGATALYVCRRYNGRDCDAMSAMVAGLIASIFLIGKRIAGSMNTDDSKRSVQSMTDFLSTVFPENGHSFQSIEDVTPVFQERSDESDGRLPLEVTSVKGLSFENQTLDFDVHDFGDGEGHLYMPISVDNGDGDLEKRAAAPAIKISYRSFKKSAFSRQEQIMGSNKISQAWDLAANQGGINNYIGLVQSDGSADFYWRIIPEKVGFGTNFEPTNICGDLGKWVV